MKTIYGHILSNLLFNMKTKKIFIIVLLLLQGNFLFSQCVNVELSVTWKMGYHIFEKDSIISVPFLNITYRNNCEENYYLFKVSPRKDGELMLFCNALRNFGDESKLKIAKLHGNFANERFNVKIGRIPWYDIAWEIEDYPNKHPISNVGCFLDDIYDYFYDDRFRKSNTRNHSFFESSILTSENILSGTVQDQFVFLKPEETHIDTYNLIGYKIVEGCFTFYIDKNEINSFVLGLSEKYELPSVVGEYHLYSGSFNTNKVTVCFGER